MLSWEKVCVPLEWGSLGIKRLRDVNISLLCKWLWELGNGENKLWKRIIFEKYGKEIGGWIPYLLRNHTVAVYGRGLCFRKIFFPIMCLSRL